MAVYRVRVDCWYLRKGKRVVERREILIEADLINEASEVATELVAETAACSDKLVAVEHRGAARLALPLEIVGVNMGKPSAFRNLKVTNQKDPS